jgi:hypothetical protein
MKRKSVRMAAYAAMALAVVACSGAYATAIPANAVVADTFDGKVVGTSIDGTTTSTGSATWSAVSVYTAVNGTGQAALSYGSGAAEVAFAPATPIISVQADINPGASGGWTGVGFANGSGYLWSVGQVWVTLDPNGGWVMYRNGANYCGSQAASVFNANASNLVSLEYNTVDKTAAVTINGHHEYTFDMDAWSYSPTITSAGFHIQSSDGTVDNFAVVPEPMTMALLAVGGVIGMVRRMA